MRMPERAGVALPSLLAGAMILALCVMLGGSACQPSGDGPVARARADIDTFKTALKLYRLDRGRFPTTAEGLEALGEPTDEWPEGMLEGFDPHDPWGNPYEYTSDGETCVIVSFGRGGIEGGEGADRDIRGEVSIPSD